MVGKHSQHVQTKFQVREQSETWFRRAIIARQSDRPLLRLQLCLFGWQSQVRWQLRCSATDKCAVARTLLEAATNQQQGQRDIS